MEDFIITTTSNIDGYTAIKYFGPVTTNIVIGTSFISDLFAGFSDLLGSKSTNYQNKLSEMYNEAIHNLKEEALKLNANCILGLKTDLDEISGKGMQMFMINAIGTAVIIQKNEDFEAQKAKAQEQIENVKKAEEEKKLKYKSMEDILNDEEIVKQAKELRRIYGENVYEDFLRKKAAELGIKY